MCKLYDENDLIDEAIVIYYKAPKSFTGEDIVEFQCHGGVSVSAMILKACLQHGARLARAGEFSKRALLNAKMDITKVEAMAALIESRSEDSAKILAKQLRGDLKEFVDKLRDSLVEVLAYIEVTIDYAQEDLDSDIFEKIMQKVDKNIALLDKALHISKSREGLLEGFKIAIVGKPNVGKSSLLNTLLSYNRAIISDIAGTTRDTIEEEIKIGSHLVKIVDTAGIRDANDEIEKIGIDRSKEAIEESEIVLALFDGSRKIDDDDKKILKLLEDYKEQKEIIEIVTKKDLPLLFDKTLLSKDYLHIVKDDREPVIKKIKNYLDTHMVGEDDIMLINQRQIDATKDAYEALVLAKSELELGEMELFAFNINSAIESLSSITKPFERDEILDSMFSSFCLGK